MDPFYAIAAQVHCLTAPADLPLVVQTCDADNTIAATSAMARQHPVRASGSRHGHFPGSGAQTVTPSHGTRKQLMLLLQANVTLVGSSASGTELNSSDLDVSVRNANITKAEIFRNPHRMTELCVRR